VSTYETHHARGDRIAPHRHELGYAALVLDGAYKELSADGVWRAEAGDLILHPAFHLHLNRFETGGARVLNVALPHAALRRLAAKHYAVLRVRDPDRCARKAEAAGIDAVGEALENAAPVREAKPRDWLDRFAADVRAGTHLRVGALARAHGVTPEHAARAFGRRFGVTPARMRAEHRLQAALRALADGVFSLAQIAAQAGYADQAHFSRAVAAATGVSPARLRATLS
jgi:AraC family transcriptional regulator